METLGQTQREIEAMLALAKILDTLNSDEVTRILHWLASRQSDRINRDYKSATEKINEMYAAWKAEHPKEETEVKD